MGAAPSTGPSALRKRFGSARAFVSLGEWADADQRPGPECAAEGGLPPERFLSHSLRIGGASALFQATGKIELVKRAGRWSSSAVQRYLHDGDIAMRDVAAKMANVERHIHYP